MLEKDGKRRRRDLKKRFVVNKLNLMQLECKHTTKYMSLGKCDFVESKNKITQQFSVSKLNKNMRQKKNLWTTRRMDSCPVTKSVHRLVFL